MGLYDDHIVESCRRPLQLLSEPTPHRLSIAMDCLLQVAQSTFPALDALRLEDSCQALSQNSIGDYCTSLQPYTSIAELDPAYSESQRSYPWSAWSSLDSQSTSPSSTTESRRQYSCAFCLLPTTTSAELQEHGQRAGHKPFVCAEVKCGKTFARADVFVRHRSIHRERGFKCRKCQWSFKRRDNLDVHVRKKHGGSSSISSDPSLR